MVSNKLSVNPNKTEYLLFTKKKFKNPNCNICTDSNIISPNDSAKNLGVIVHSDVSMDKQTYIYAIAKHRIRPFISKTTAITLANAYLYIYRARLL